MKSNLLKKSLCALAVVATLASAGTASAWHRYYHAYGYNGVIIGGGMVPYGRYHVPYYGYGYGPYRDGYYGGYYGPYYGYYRGYYHNCCYRGYRNFYYRGYYHRCGWVRAHHNRFGYFIPGHRVCW